MSATEFAEWIAYERIEPFGTVREDMRAGLIASTLLNLYKKKGTKASNWEDFIPPYEKRRPNTWHDLLAKVVSFNRVLGGKDLRNERSNDRPA